MLASFNGRGMRVLPRGLFAWHRAILICPSSIWSARCGAAVSCTERSVTLGIAAGLGYGRDYWTGEWFVIVAKAKSTSSYHTGEDEDCWGAGWPTSCGRQGGVGEDFRESFSFFGKFGFSEFPDGRFCLSVSFIWRADEVHDLGTTTRLP